MPQVVFYNDASTGYTCRLFQQYERVVSVVQHVNKGDEIDAVVGERNGLAIERSDWNMGISSDQNINPFDCKFWADLHKLRHQQTVPTSHIK